MAIYLFTFVCCFFADYFKGKNNTIYAILVAWIYVFLCFGYMTGSDWRSYELLYNTDKGIQTYKESEFGFVFLIKVCRVIFPDFWVFNGLSKVFHLFALSQLISIFTNNKWTVIGISFTYSTLFMLIDCPMRFMIGSSFFYFAFSFFVRKKYFYAILFGAISLTFHVTMIIPILIGLSSIISTLYSRISKYWMIFLLLFVYVVINELGIYERIFNTLIPMMNMDKFGNASSYSDYDTSAIWSIGRLKELVLFCFIVYKKDLLISLKHGSIVYYLGTIAILLTPILSAIPTAFRLNIFSTNFTIISFVLLVTYPNFVCRIRPIIKYFFYIIFFFLLMRNVMSTYKYYPYSNSIPYILSSHLPYSERDSYNINVYNYHNRK